MAEKKSWLKIIGQLKKFIREVGPLWPNSTKLSGYAENGPFHCSDCSFLKKVDGAPLKDEQGKGRCNHPVVIADPEVKKDKKGLGIINIETGCCEFVDQPKEHHGEETKD